jgi:hypothetical protein
MAQTKATRRGLFSRAKWPAVGVLVAAAAVAQVTGYLGFAIGELKASVFPRDNGLLEYLPDTTRALVVIDPHRIDVMSVGGPRGQIGTNLVRIREDIKHLTGVDMYIDVDKIILSPSLVVARGRFDAARIASKLAESRYASAEYKGHTYLVRPGEDALAVLGDVLLYGDEPAIRASLDAQAAKTSLAESDRVKDRLSAIGWGNPLIATVQLLDERPSIKQTVAGSTGPRAYSVAIRTHAGMDVDVLVEAASPGAAQETARLLDEKRKDAPPALLRTASPALVDRLGAAAKAAVIAAPPESSSVSIKVHLDQPTIDAATGGVGQLLPPGAARDFRLLQLLVP